MRAISSIHVVLGLILILTISSCFSAESGIIYSNPRVYNVDYSFEMAPDPNNIDRARDLKVWIPIPREWDSQKAVKIISVQPEAHARYVDPEYGNPMLFWDFGKEAEQPTYKVDIKFRLESYDVSVEVEPNRVGSYDKTSDDYVLYTRSTHTISITPKIRELAQEAIGDETNPYLQAKQILSFVKKKVHFKVLDFERGRGIKCLLDFPVKDEKTGEEYYEGCCNQDTALFVALCRAVGIPARSVGGYIGWSPGGEMGNLKARYPFETKISPEGLATTQFYTELDSHTWGECFIPNYGWIPTDGKLERQNNKRWIMLKGRDIQIGPCAPQEGNEGYGAFWVALHDGRADMGKAIMNIAKIHTSKIKITHRSDPFPANGLTVYGKKPFTVITNAREDDSGNWRQDVLSLPSCYAEGSVSHNLNLERFYKDHPATQSHVDAFICHMLRRQLGDEKYFELIDRYVGLRQEMKEAVSTDRFQKLTENIYGEPLDWFFKQWVNGTEWPQLKLEKVAVTKDKKGWQVQGRLLQLGDTTFRLPIELAIDTTKDRKIHRLWVETKSTEFVFHTQDEPQELIVDPDFEVLKVQKTAPHIGWFWYVYPEYIIVYGTLADATENRSAAHRFNELYFGLGQDIIKADMDVNETDLKTKCVFLIGRPETNKIAQQFKDSFPINFNGAKFAWQGTTYDKPSQRVAQVIENPMTRKGFVVMYAGLSPEATLQSCDLWQYGPENSYVIFDGDNQLVSGDWEDVDSNLYWTFDSQTPAVSPSNQP